MDYNKESQPENTTNWTVDVDDKTETVTISCKFSREELNSRVQELIKDNEDEGENIAEEGLFPIRRIWWCVKCQSGERKSVKAYTEVDAGFKACGVQSFSVSRGKC